MKTNLQNIPGTDLFYEHHVPVVEKVSPYPLLFIHGMFGGSWEYAIAMEYALINGFEVYALNLRGHAPWQKVDSSSIEDYVEDCIKMLRYIDKPTIVVGHSMAGLLAQDLVAKLSWEKKALVQGAVFMATNIPGKILCLNEMARWRYGCAMITKRPFDMVPEDACSLFMNQTPAGFRKSFLGSFTQESGMVLRQIAFGLVSIDETSIARPTLVISYKDDKRGIQHQEKELAARYNSDYKLLEGDHLAFMTSPDSIKQIVNWIRSNEWYYVMDSTLKQSVNS